jgi:limonene-1,2-epoxide hydrolase
MSDTAPFLGAATEAPEISTVRSFLAALDKLDIDAAIEYTAADIVYQNVPLPPARGRAAVAKQLGLLARYGTGFEAQIHHIASDGPVVLTERTDIVERGRLRADFWVCGTFEVRDGRIELWRDYFDWLSATGSLLKGLVKAALPASTARPG